MTATTINIPYLTPGLTYTVDAIDPADESVLQADIALTLSGTTGTGTVTAAIDTRVEWVIKQSGNIVEVRVRSIVDDAGPYRIVTGLDGTGNTELPVNPSDDELLSTGWMICYHKDGSREDGVDITIQLTSGNGLAGSSHDTEPRTATSATVDGIVGYVEFPGMVRGATYSVVRGDVDETSASPFAVRSAGPTQSTTVPDSASFKLTQVLGRETS